MSAPVLHELFFFFKQGVQLANTCIKMHVLAKNACISMYKNFVSVYSFQITIILHSRNTCKL